MEWHVMRDDREEDIRDEIRFHLEEEQADLEEAGQDSSTAGRAAMRTFGNRTKIEEDIRDVWVSRRWQEFCQDVTYCLRSFRRSPGFTAATLFYIAMGIGAVTAVAGIANASMFRSLPYPEPERLAVLYEQRPRENLFTNVVSYPDFADWRDQNQVFSAMAANQSSNFVYTSTGEPQRVEGGAVSAGYFDVLGIQPRLGRGFRPADESAGDASIVIVTDGFWRRNLGASDVALGRPLVLNGRSYTLGGVLPAGFRAPIYAWEVFIPLQSAPMLAAGSRDGHTLGVVARLKPGMSLDQARQNMDVISKALERVYPGNKGHYANVVPMAEALHGQFRPATFALLGAALLVLLIACFNVANLLLARAVSRAQEISVRLALGAGRARIVRQLVTESLLLSLIGGVAGVVLAAGGMVGIRAILPAYPALGPQDIRLDWTVLGITTAVAVGSGLLFGLAPALTGTWGGVHRVVRAAGRSQTGSRLRTLTRSAIVAVEAGLAVMLLVGAGLLLRSFWTMQAVSPGFSAERVLTMQLSLPFTYERDALQFAFQQRMLERVRALPGVLSAGFTSFLPIAGDNSRRGLAIEGTPPDPNQEPRRANWRLVTPGYIETMQIPLIKGRLLRDTDVQGAPPVMLINETAARSYWTSGRDPIGTRARLAGYAEFATVVGVVGDVKHWGLERPARPEAYFSSLQYPFFRMSLVLRTHAEPETLMASVRQVLKEIDSNLPPVALQTMESVLERSWAPRRFLTLLVTGFATLALLLAAGGIYAQLAYSVSQRKKEIGLRVAMGARRGDVVRMVLKQGLAVTLTGLVLGMMVMAAMARLLQQVLFGIQALDLWAMVAAPVVLLAAAALACAIPAWRASCADPAAILRQD
jgi:putative ABC transport system permease protein